MLRTVFAFLIGAVVMGAAVAGLQALGHWIWPPPSGIDPSTPDDVARLIAAMPIAAKIWVLVSYATAVEVATIAAVLVHRPRWRGLAMAMGLLMAALSALNFWLLPHPWWMVVIGLLMPLPIAMTAGWWLRPPAGSAG